MRTCLLVFMFCLTLVGCEKKVEPPSGTLPYDASAGNNKNPWMTSPAATPSK